MWVVEETLRSIRQAAPCRLEGWLCDRGEGRRGLAGKRGREEKAKAGAPAGISRTVLYPCLCPRTDLQTNICGYIHTDVCSSTDCYTDFRL